MQMDHGAMQKGSVIFLYIRIAPLGLVHPRLPADLTRPEIR